MQQDINLVLTKLIHAGVKHYFQNKEELPQHWKGYIIAPIYKTCNKSDVTTNY